MKFLYKIFLILAIGLVFFYLYIFIYLYIRMVRERKEKTGIKKETIYGRNCEKTKREC